jgi:putative selenate reductase FAD-binding subunit
MVTEFARPATVEEALRLQKEGYTFLAGGTQVNNGAARDRGAGPAKVASLDALELGGIQVQGERPGAGIPGEAAIGAMVTLQQLADSTALHPAISAAAAFIPTRSVRNMATIGGNIAARRSDSYLIPVLVALDAVAEIPEGDISVEEYVREDRNALILRVRIPPVAGVCRVVKESRSHIALPVVSAAVRVVVQDAVTEARVVAGCVAPRTTRLVSVEQLITRRDARHWLEPAGTAELEGAVAAAVNPSADFLGSAEYKRYVNAVVITDCIVASIREALS